MTYEKVLKHYKDNYCKHCCSWNKELRHCDDCMVATVIEILEKQIPQKVIWETDHTWGIASKTPICPACDYGLTRMRFIGDGDRVTYCETCGQAIRWE